jgi:hypothetical protein
MVGVIPPEGSAMKRYLLTGVTPEVANRIAELCDFVTSEVTVNDDIEFILNVPQNGDSLCAFAHLLDRFETVEVHLLV